MPYVKLIYVYHPEEPDKKFIICYLEDSDTFADPLSLFSILEYDKYNINEKGLYAIGGTLNIETMLKSYKWGIFPWFSYKTGEDVHWYCPRQRYVIFPNKVHIGHSLRNLLKKGNYRITINKEFQRVIHNCRTVNKREEEEYAWLGEKIEGLFINLYKMGYAKSVELWEGDLLIGGFYGFWYKGIFQGESMFSLRPSASQIALILLCKEGFIESKKIKLIDTQFETPTFKRLGGEYIDYRQYREILKS